MNQNQNQNGINEMMAGFKSYASKRIVVGLVIVIAGIWLGSTVISHYDKNNKPAKQAEPAHVASETSVDEMPFHVETKEDLEKEHTEVQHEKEPVKHEEEVADHFTEKEDTHSAAPEQSTEEIDPHAKAPEAHGSTEVEGKLRQVKGVAFIRACTKPMEYELEERFWGWRPNDIIEFTDNVNEFQLGTLEVTRRAVEKLAERISRTGSTASFDKSLERARSSFNIRPSKYWFPSPEKKYRSAIERLREYQEKLVKGEANFYSRPDNLIPLLATFRDLLGSCDENLVKAYEDDGSKVSTFDADNYFFYSQGVASAMAEILEAVGEDFAATIRARHGEDSLHHAILSCQKATKLDPFLITNSNLSGILANHRANLATHISHARFYLGVLITTLST